MFFHKSAQMGKYQHHDMELHLTIDFIKKGIKPTRTQINKLQSKEVRGFCFSLRHLAQRKGFCIRCTLGIMWPSRTTVHSVIAQRMMLLTKYVT